MELKGELSFSVTNVISNTSIRINFFFSLLLRSDHHGNDGHVTLLLLTVTINTTSGKCTHTAASILVGRNHAPVVWDTVFIQLKINLFMYPCRFASETGRSQNGDF